jgi:trans-aconitate methyltransferase
MTTYDPVHYWQTRGETYEAKFRAERYRDQEAALIETLEALPTPRSVLEVGCGFGRIGALVRDLWPDARYMGLDLSPVMLASARERLPDGEFRESALADFRPGFRRWDVVLAVEFLMHVPPGDIEAAVGRLLGLARRAVVSCDWTIPARRSPAGHNFLHDYHALYAVAGPRMVGTRDVGLQTIFTVEPG